MIQAVSRVVLLALLVGLGAGGSAWAEASEQHQSAGSDWVSQATQTCAGCHGKKGVSQTATFPVLAGQHEDYLLHTLEAYRDGGRTNAIMSGQVQGMSDTQLEALAHYYSQQESPLHTPDLEE